MPGDLIYANEKYSTAVDIMATGQADLRERLLDAYISQARRVIPILPGDGPEMTQGLADRIEKFDRRLTSTTPLGDEGSYRASVDAMTEQEVQEAAEELVAIHHYIQMELRDHGEW
jgi:hypothetical protein